MDKQLHPLVYLARQLGSPPGPDPFMACDFDPEKLALFVSDELAGYPVDELYPELAHHLDLCERCLQEYIELSQLAANAFNSLDLP